jgi:hypothetical protein
MRLLHDVLKRARSRVMGIPRKVSFKLSAPESKVRDRGSIRSPGLPMNGDTSLMAVQFVQARWARHLWIRPKGNFITGEGETVRIFAADSDCNRAVG